jgi:hypothetical protein
MKRRILDTIDEQPQTIMFPSLPISPIVPRETIFSVPMHVELPVAPTPNLPSLTLDLGAISPGAMFWLETEEDTDLVSSALSIVDKEMSKYDKNFDKAKYIYEQEKAIYDKEVENVIKNADFASEHLIRQIAEREKELVVFDKDMVLYQAEITEFTNKLSALEKQFTQDKDKVKERYEWLGGHLQILQLEYEQLFGGGKQPQAQGGQ